MNRTSNRAVNRATCACGVQQHVAGSIAERNCPDRGKPSGRIPLSAPVSAIGQKRSFSSKKKTLEPGLHKLSELHESGDLERLVGTRGSFQSAGTGTIVSAEMSERTVTTRSSNHRSPRGVVPNPRKPRTGTEVRREMKIGYQKDGDHGGPRYLYLPPHFHVEVLPS